ncbi:acyltransferase family protein [Desertivirga arenae]|uniref:acyltransferase family protein n=1 Tax=Desertivirga arenae TaxID=2810309 RepID=UPI001A96560C|nr:acyltransferase [Pedobacter sp. SYSU D00823]
MSEKPYSQSIQNLRTIAVIGVVLHHAVSGIYRGGNNQDLPGFLYLQLVNYGSILFMVISGYFFEKSIKKYPVKELVKKKFRNILLPYLLFVFPWFFFEYFISPYYGKERGPEVTVGEAINTVLFKTNYWFIINLIIIQLLNFFITKVSQVRWLVLLFTVITLFYSANIYLRLFESAHSYAFLGFLSFFFCGRLIYRYSNVFQMVYEKVTGWKYYPFAFLPLLVLFYAVAIKESQWIHRHDPYTDFGNVLRLSNILFTGLLLLIFYRKRAKFNFGRAFTNKSVFLIYLTHPYFMRIGSFIINRFDISSWVFGMSGILMNISFGIAILMFSLGASRLLLSCGFLK